MERPAWQRARVLRTGICLLPLAALEMTRLQGACQADSRQERKLGMPQSRLVQERCVRWMSIVVAGCNGVRPNSREARDIESLARDFVREGMGPWEAVRAAAVLVLKKYGKRAA